MSEIENPPIAASPESEPQAAPAPRRRRGIVVIAVALAVAVVIAVLAWQAWSGLQESRHAQDDRAQLEARVDALARAAERARQDVDALRARLDDAAKVNAALREQLLALSDRARLVEDAVANLADKRLSGHDAMQLNEAEMLLALGAERYTLFHDAPAAIEAYRLADSALASVEDAAFSTVRQSISAEAQAFAAAGSADGAPALAALASLRADADRLPAAARGLGSAAADAGDSRWERALARFVRIHRADEAAPAQRHEAALARQLFQLDLRDAEAALLARDEPRFRAALADARALLEQDFDAAATEVESARATLAGLAGLALAPPPPAILGAALKELRNLRATHALRATPAAHPAAAAKPDEGQQ